MTTVTVNKDEHMFILKYRPQTIQECILPKADKEIFLEYVKKGRVPHMILQSNTPGTGKTSVALALCNDIDAEMLFVNGSDCKLDFVRTELTRFASSMSIEGKPKVIVIDEFDRSGLHESQRHLRSFMEAYGNCSIIMTANNLEGIIEPLRSRAKVIKFGSPTEEDKKTMQKEMLQRIIEICKLEDIKVDNPKVLAALVKKNFPDFRNTINQVDYYATKGYIDEGVFDVVIKNSAGIEDVLHAIESKDLKTIRELASKYSLDYENFVQKLANELYQKVDKKSIIKMYEIIGENNQYHGLAGSLEIHVTYLCVQLALEMVFK